LRGFVEAFPYIETLGSEIISIVYSMNIFIYRNYFVSQVFEILKEFIEKAE